MPSSDSKCSTSASHQDWTDEDEEMTAVAAVAQAEVLVVDYAVPDRRGLQSPRSPTYGPACAVVKGRKPANDLPWAFLPVKVSTDCLRIQLLVLNGTQPQLHCSRLTCVSDCEGSMGCGQRKPSQKPCNQFP